MASILNLKKNLKESLSGRGHSTWFGLNFVNLIAKNLRELLCKMHAIIGDENQGI